MPLLVSFRSLSRRPGLVLVVILCLGLGLGVNVAMFGILDDLRWDLPQGVVEPDGVLRVYATRVYPGAGPITSDAFSYPAYMDLQEARLGAVAALSRTEVVTGTGLEGSKRWAELVSSSYFPLLGIRPALGRFFSKEEAQPSSGARVVVLSHRLWQGRFRSDPEILDREVSIQAKPHRVIGVAPPGFLGVDQQPVDLWLSMGALPMVFGEGLEESRGSQILQMLLRSPRYSRPQLLDEVLTSYYRSIHEEESPGSPDAGAQLSLWPLLPNRGPHPSRETRVAVWTCAVALLVLLISIANVANLLIVRGLERRQESALRLALGARKTALVRDAVLEGGILTLGGVLAAVPVASVVIALVQRFLLPETAGTGKFLDGRLLVFSGVLALATGFACSLLAAFPLRRFQLAGTLRTGAVGRAGPRSLRDGLLVGQVALAAVLLVGAGLFLRSLAKVKALDLGVEPEGLLVVTLDAGGNDHPPQQTETVFRDAGRRIRAMPGVEAVSIVATPPFGTSYGIGIAAPGLDELPTLATGGPYLSVVDRSYFDVAGLELIEGRTFRPGGDGPSVIVNQTLAELLWSKTGALGECLVVGEVETAPCSTVVGVVEDARRQRIQEPPTMQVYVPLDQGPDWIFERALVIRAAGEPAQLVNTVRREVLAVAPGLPYVDAEILVEKLSDQYRSWRLGANVFSLFAGLAALLTLAGIYGVTAYMVAQRRRELGIRMALGANPRVLKLLLTRQGLKPAILGVVLGLAGALLLGRALQAQLFEVSPWDPATLVVVALGLLVSTSGAIWWSTRRLRGLEAVEVLAVD